MDTYGQPTEPTTEYQGLSIIKTLLVIVVLAAIAGAAISYMIATKPEAKRGKPPKSAIAVEVVNVTSSDYPIKVATNGTVAAETRGNLVAQVPGEIIEITDNFANGGSFKKGDVLLKIDGRDFQAAMQTAQASLSQSKVILSQERASAAQAEKDWERLGFEGKPNDLVMRKPQLNAAISQRDSAQSSYNKAQLDFSRTRVKAPYDGFVIQKNVSLGQFVSTGTILAEVFSAEGLEVQLPLNQDQFAQLSIKDQPEVILHSELGGEKHSWQASIIRTDSVFDTTTRQLNATAKISNAISDKGLELKIGQYVTAEIAGRVARDVKVIPNQAIREGSYVFIYDNGILRRQEIKTIWQDTLNAVVEGIDLNQMVVTTAVGSSLNGSKATLLSDVKKGGERQGSGKKGGDSNASPKKKQGPPLASEGESCSLDGSAKNACQPGK